MSMPPHFAQAAIAQLGERQTEDLKVSGSIPGLGIGKCQHTRAAVESKSKLQAASWLGALFRLLLPSGLLTK